MNALLPRWSLVLMVTAIAACGGNVVGASGAGGSGSGGSGAGGSEFAPCPPQEPDLCTPSTACVNGQNQSGGATCWNGHWVCNTTPCSECSQMIHVCVAGMIQPTCCEPGVWCDAPPSYCDLGDGHCFDGPCVDAGVDGSSDGG